MQALIICFDCKHNNGDLTCKAFPSGIPEEILSGVNDHSEPLPEQPNSITYEKEEEDAEQ